MKRLAVAEVLMLLVAMASVAVTDQVLHTLEYLEPKASGEANLRPWQEGPTERAVVQDSLAMGEALGRARTSLLGRFPSVVGLQVWRTSTILHMDATIFGRSF
jgi:hypothetical protein